MNQFEWEEAKLSTLYYLDNHFILECVSLGPEHGKFIFSDYSPWGFKRNVIECLRKRGFVSSAFCTVNNLSYKKYTISRYGRAVFHRGDEI